MELIRRDEGALLPLGKGYSRPLHFLNAWESLDQTGDQPDCSLEASLRQVSPVLPPGYLRRVLEAAPKCLISGCSLQRNPRALAAFLTAHHVPAPEIHVIDLIDLAKIWKPSGGTRFHVADAANLRELFADDSFDLIVQDFLLNCAPVSEYDNILSEMARVVRRSGLVLFNYADSRHFPESARGNSLVEDRVQRGQGQYSFGTALDEESGVPCQLVRTSLGYTAITEPWGNLESFVSLEELEPKLSRASLVIQQRVEIDVTDANGLLCHRSYCVLTRR